MLFEELLCYPEFSYINVCFYFFQFSCCGIDGYKDYTNISIFEMPIYPDRDRNFVPASCCWGLVTICNKESLSFLNELNNFKGTVIDWCFAILLQLFKKLYSPWTKQIWNLKPNFVWTKNPFISFQCQNLFCFTHKWRHTFRGEKV